MARVSHTINMVIFGLFLLLAIVLSLANWGIILFSIADIVMIHSAKAILVYKIWAAIAISAVILSHAFFYQIMYDSIISLRIQSWVNQHSTALVVWLSLGYINTYLVDLFYIKEKYTQYELLQYGINVTSSTIAMFPILNIVIYHSIIKKLRKNAQLLSTKELIILYLKGQLMTYLIRVKQ